MALKQLNSITHRQGVIMAFADVFLILTVVFVGLAFLALVVESTLVLPLVVAVVAGDSIAGEANRGTLRYLLAVPAGRTRLLGIKLAAR